MPRAACIVGVGRRAKRETALVSFNDLNARHSGKGVILLVGPRSYDAHLSVPFLSDMQHKPKLSPTVRLLCRSILNFDLATFLLVLCFPLVFEGLWYWQDFKVDWVEPFQRAVWTFMRSLLTPALIAARGIAVTVTVALPRLFCVFLHRFRRKERLLAV